MKILELDEGDSVGKAIVPSQGQIVRVDAKRALVGAGARILFYPTLLYNVFRNKIQAEFRWWDEVDQGVITLNESYETLVPTSLYHDHGIEHLVIPTRDYLFAPSFVDINRAVNFIHKNASSGRTTYVHCKAGRGRSTTIVLCYLVKYKHMTPADALEHVRSKRPRVLLAPSQWKAVQEYGKHQLSFPAIQSRTTPSSPSTGDEVLITEADLEGYVTYDNECKELSITCRRAVPARPMIARLSCLFASLKVSSGCCSYVGGRLPEIRAC